MELARAALPQSCAREGKVDWISSPTPLELDYEARHVSNLGINFVPFLVLRGF